MPITHPSAAAKHARPRPIQPVHRDADLVDFDARPGEQAEFEDKMKNELEAVSEGDLCLRGGKRLPEQHCAPAERHRRI